MLTAYLLVIFVSTGYGLGLNPETGLIQRTYNQPRIELKRGFKTKRDCLWEAQSVMKARPDTIATCAEDYST